MSAHRLVRRARTYGIVAFVVAVAAVVTVWAIVWLRSMSPPRPGPVLVEPMFRTTPTPSPVPQTIPVLPVPSVSRSRSPVRPPAVSRSASRSHRPSPRASSARRPTLTAAYTTGASWDTDFIGSVQVGNTGSAPLSWTVTIRYRSSDGVRVGQAWNATVDRQADGGVFRGGPLAPGGTVVFGFETTKSTRDRVRPVSCTINGSACVMR